MPSKLIAEFVGTALLLSIVVGSGIMGEALCGGNVAVALLANSFATGLGLTVLIFIFAPFSGAHFNPVVTLSAAISKEVPWNEAVLYCVAQGMGAVLGVLLAHVMFHEPYFLMESTKVRDGFSQYVSEGIATFGLLLTIKSVSRYHSSITPFAVGAYIASAYWFTASTSFANPAVTLARAFTPTFAGIHPNHVFAFCVSQCVGAGMGVVLFRILEKGKPK